METTLDFIENIKFDSQNPPISNYQALGYLKQGIFHLAASVRQKELKKIKEFSGASEYFSFGGQDNLEKAELRLLACQFHWFGLSLVNYVRLVGLIGLATKHGWKTADIRDNKANVKGECRDYVQKVIPEILQWRNKVLAHFAITDPWSDDNIATLEMSIMNPISFTENYYWFGAFQLVANEESSSLPQWAVTDVFIKLIPRFWPEVKIINSTT